MLKVPDCLARLTAEVAKQENASVDQIVALALSAQADAWRIRDDSESQISGRRGAPPSRFVLFLSPSTIQNSQFIPRFPLPFGGFVSS